MSTAEPPPILLSFKRGMAMAMMTNQRRNERYQRPLFSGPSKQSLFPLSPTFPRALPGNVSTDLKAVCDRCTNQTAVNPQNNGPHGHPWNATSPPRIDIIFFLLSPGKGLKRSQPTFCQSDPRGVVHNLSFMPSQDLCPLFGGGGKFPLGKGRGNTLTDWFCRPR